ncbi:MAG: gluconokinase [Chloroflexota bacterium]
MIIILMGVSGSGKTSIGTELASHLDGKFFDGDDFHPAENVEKMKSGIPLDDADRAPWLNIIHNHMVQCQNDGLTAVIACSALKNSYRDQLAAGETSSAIFVYLKGSYELILSRMQARANHFFKADMLKTQFNALEEPSQNEAIIVDINQSPNEVVEAIISQLNKNS